MTIKIPDTVPVQSVASVDGSCIDCGESASTHTLSDGAQCVCHAGKMCEGFRARFTSTAKNPIRTPGLDETGDITDWGGKKTLGRNRRK